MKGNLNPDDYKEHMRVDYIINGFKSRPVDGYVYNQKRHEADKIAYENDLDDYLRGQFSSLYL